MTKNKYLQPLKLASMVVGLAGYFIANEMQRRETREVVEEVLAEREARSQATPAE